MVDELGGDQPLLWIVGLLPGGGFRALVGVFLVWILTVLWGVLHVPTAAGKRSQACRAGQARPVCCDANGRCLPGGGGVPRPRLRAWLCARRAAAGGVALPPQAPSVVGGGDNGPVAAPGVVGLFQAHPTAGAAAHQGSVPVLVLLVGASAGVALPPTFVPVVGVVSVVALRHSVVYAVPIPVTIAAIDQARRTGVGVAVGISGVAVVAVAASIAVAVAVALLFTVGIAHAVAVVLVVVSVSVTVPVAVAVALAVAFAVPLAFTVTVAVATIALSRCGCCSSVCPRACGCLVLCTYSRTSEPSTGTGACAAAAGGGWTLPAHHSVTAAAVWPAVAQPRPPAARAAGAHPRYPPRWLAICAAARGATGLAASAQWPRAGPDGAPTRCCTAHGACQKGADRPRTGGGGAAAAVGGTPHARHKAHRLPVAGGGV